MKKVLLLAMAFSCWAGGSPANAQQGPLGKDNQNRGRVAEELRQKYNANREKALQLAKQKNWVVQQVQPDGTVISLQGVDHQGYPIYHTTYNNVRAAASTRTHEVWTGGLQGLDLNGGSQAMAGKLGVWDGGAVRATHQELRGRIVNRDGATTLSDHATHVAGTMIASGVNPLAKGMSHKAINIQAWDFNNDIPEMVAGAPNLLISNHSYGSISGWRLNGTTWEFWGRFNENEDFKFGQYNDQARDWDVITFNNPYYLPVKSSGNNRSQTGPAIGQPYSRFNALGQMASAGTRPAGISSNNSYDIISTYGTAKNILTIGAVEPISNSYQQPSDVKISSFSSWGPTDDGRIKPDIVGNGVNLLSSYSTADDAYASISGTSMSSPNVSGSINLLQEHFSNLNGGKFMRAATLKALVLQTADEAGTSPGPDYIHGWGLLNTSRAAQVISNTKNTNLIDEKELAQGQTHTFTVVASGSGPLVVTIAWTDPEATASTLLNDRAPKLVNDLDLRVSQGLNSFRPWILDPANPSAPAMFGDNVRDNVEQVFLANAVPGQSYTITVNHKGTLARVPQAYSVVVSGIGGAAICSSKASSNADAKITNVTFGTISNTSAEGCATYTDNTSLFTALQVGQTLPLSIGVGTCGTDADKIAKVFIDWNGDNTFDETTELAATSGVLSGTTTFTTNVSVPSYVIVGNRALMRVVLVETTNPADVRACGDYAKGETQDYTVQFIQATSDVGVVSLLSPKDGICANPAQGNIAVVIKNFGTGALSNIPVQVTINGNDGSSVTLNTTYTRTLAAYGEATVSVPGTYNAQTGETYTFTASTSLTDDANPLNNQHVATRKVSDATVAPSALSATVCGEDAVLLRGTGNGTIFWYNAPTGGQLVAAGNTTSTMVKPANNTYYAALNDFSGKVGLSTKDFTGAGGGYNQFGPSMMVTAKVPFILEKARLYIGNPGTITFTVSTLNGSPVSSVTLDVAATRTTAGPGAQTNDLNDLGQVYDLNLEFPAAGNYQISIEYGNGATTYRNNAGASYPYEIPNVLSITGNSSNLPLAYYNLYDMQVKALGCAGSRVAVQAEVASAATALITPAGPTTFCQGESVVLNAGGNGTTMTYMWRKDGAVINGATTGSFTASEAGSYTVTVTNSNGCSKTSAPVTTKVNPLPPVANIAAASSTELCAGQPISVALRAITATSEGITYQWKRNGVILTGATAFSYTATLTGTYTVEVTRAPCGTSVSEPVTITQEDPNLTAANALICGESGSVNLTASSNFGNLFWYDAATGGNLVGTGSSFTTPTLTASTSYYVGLNDLKGAAGAPSKTANGAMSAFTGGRMYFDAEVPFMLEKATINVGAAGTMTVIMVDKDFSNSIIATRTITVTTGVREYDLNLFVPKAGKNYGLQVSAFGPVPGSTSTATASAYRTADSGAVNFPYVVPNLMSLTGTNQADQTAFYYFLYDLKVKAAGCSPAERKKVDVTVSPLPALVVTTPAAVCSGTSVNLAAAINTTSTLPSGTTLTYWATRSGAGVLGNQITPGTNGAALVNATGTYFIQAETTAGCKDVKLVNVTVNPLPIAQAVAQKPTVYYGYAPEASTNLTASATSGKAPYTYLWSTGARTATIKVSPKATITYTVTVTDALGCTSTAEVTVTVVNVICGPAKNAKVLICNRAGQEVCVEAKDVPDHLKNGGSLGSCDLQSTSVASVVSPDLLIEGLKVSAYPNPFSSLINIEITTEKAENVTFEVYDIRGALVKRLYTGTTEAGQVKRLELDGSQLAEGLYLGRLITKGRVQTLKLVLRK